ncbi:DUF4897 domain-containing protein [Halobacteriales archaeon QS_1_68_20]|nr:MAG: DUF4897 domain-containing protein [Halobacteriales archaeon QS_1_68_20]
MSAGTAGTAPAAVSSATATPSAPPTDDTVTRVRVYENGSARWTIEIRTRLRTDDDVEHFRSFQEQFRGNTSAYLDPFADRITGVVADAANATGREMTATDFTAETSVQEVPRRWGVVSFSFRWSEFAATDREALVVGDVFQGGFFLAENDSMVVAGPEDYEVAETTPTADDAEGGAVTWTGRRDFSDGRPRVRFEPDGSDPTSADALPWTPLAVAGLGVAGVGAWLYRRRDPDGSAGGGESAGSAEGSTDSGAAGQSTDGVPSDPDAAVLTDAERVEALLAEGSGRMRQADVADALDWSASKTSRVVGDMAEEGRVEKLRVGRENVVELGED